MGDFKKNPRNLFVGKVPNKIRKRIAMHEKESIELSSLGQLLMPPIMSMQKKRGSMWSRFTAGMNAFLGRI